MNQYKQYDIYILYYFSYVALIDEKLNICLINDNRLE